MTIFTLDLMFNGSVYVVEEPTRDLTTSSGDILTTSANVGLTAGQSVSLVVDNLKVTGTATGND